jgi:hypothetical protein
MKFPLPPGILTVAKPATPVKLNRLFHRKEQTDCCGSATIGPDERRLFSEKTPEPRQLNDVVRRQNRANQIGLRRCVDFIEMTLRFAKLHKLPDALV